MEKHNYWPPNNNDPQPGSSSSSSGIRNLFVGEFDDEDDDDNNLIYMSELELQLRNEAGELPPFIVTVNPFTGEKVEWGKVSEAYGTEEGLLIATSDESDNHEDGGAAQAARDPQPQQGDMEQEVVVCDQVGLEDEAARKTRQGGQDEEEPRSFMEVEEVVMGGSGQEQGSGSGPTIHLQQQQQSQNKRSLEETGGLPTGGPGEPKRMKMD